MSHQLYASYTGPTPVWIYFPRITIEEETFMSRKNKHSGDCSPLCILHFFCELLDAYQSLLAVKTTKKEVFLVQHGFADK